MGDMHISSARLIPSLIRVQEFCRFSGRKSQGAVREIQINRGSAMEIVKFRSQLSVGSEQVSTHLQRVEGALTKMGRRVADEFLERRCAWEDDLRKLQAGSRNVLVVANEKILKFRSQLSVASEQVSAHLQRAQGTLVRLTGSVDKPRALRAREGGLKKLLASSLDAVVVTSVDRRFVAANPKALSLFGISEANMPMFTLDAFLSRSQIPYFDENGTAFVGRAERHGECEIRRLDGSVRVAHYIFVANYLPFQHVCKFRNDRKGAPRKRLAA